MMAGLKQWWTPGRLAAWEGGVGNDGHRQRLRTRFLKDMGDSMPDYELLELLLTQALPRGDVNPLAKALLAAFKDWNGVLTATPTELSRIPGIGEASVVAIKVVRQATGRFFRQRVGEQAPLRSSEAMIEYYAAAVRDRKTEQVRVLFLNNSGRLMADELCHDGTINHAPVYPREVARRAVELSAASIIMVHNHPGGDPRPRAPISPPPDPSACGPWGISERGAAIDHRLGIGHSSTAPQP